VCYAKHANAFIVEVAGANAVEELYISNICPVSGGLPTV
jgi:hypothetical protein